MGYVRPLLSLCGACLVLVGVARAQDGAPPPAHIAVLDGGALLNRDGQPEQAIENMPLVAGDRLRTTGGRVETLFPDGTALDVDQASEIALESETRIRLTEGLARLRVPRARYVVTRYVLETPRGSVVALHAGEYRLSSPDADEPARTDDFERWVAGRPRVDAAPAASASAQYLPSDLQMYGPTLDAYGGWQYDRRYGYVWYPTVPPGWRPYFEGSWVPLRPYGWTWVGAGPWSWPTQHYGRWGWWRDRWFWIPAATWGPAWVAWGTEGDYVAWCPLGWDSRPALALSAGYADPWVGWTVTTRGAFRDRPMLVARHVVSPHRLRLVPGPFVVVARPPMAVPRALAADGPAAARPETAPRDGLYSRSVPGRAAPGAPGRGASGAYTGSKGRPGSRAPDKAHPKKKGGVH